MANNFKVYAEQKESSGVATVYSDSDFADDEERQKGSVPNSIIRSKLNNTALREVSLLSTALINALESLDQRTSPNVTYSPNDTLSDFTTKLINVIQSFTLDYSDNINTSLSNGKLDKNSDSVLNQVAIVITNENGVLNIKTFDGAVSNPDYSMELNCNQANITLVYKEYSGGVATLTKTYDLKSYFDNVDTLDTRVTELEASFKTSYRHLIKIEFNENDGIIQGKKYQGTIFFEIINHNKTELTAATFTQNYTEDANEDIAGRYLATGQFRYRDSDEDNLYNITDVKFSGSAMYLGAYKDHVVTDSHDTTQSDASLSGRFYVYQWNTSRVLVSFNDYVSKNR